MARRTAQDGAVEWVVRPGNSLSLGLGVTIITVLVIATMSSRLITPWAPGELSGLPLERPSSIHLLGTNSLGQDLLADLLYGAQASLTVMVAATLLGTLLAMLVGLGAGLAGQHTGPLLTRGLDLFMALPQLPIMIVLSAYFPPGLTTTIGVIAAFGWPASARVIRARVLGLRHEDYVTASNVCGAGLWRIGRAHILPGLIPILVAAAVGQASRAVSLEAGLAVLGLGDPLSRSWGMSMRSALNYPGLFFTASWLWWLLPLVAALCLLVLALTLVGVGLEQLTDPRLRSAHASNVRREKGSTDSK